LTKHAVHAPDESQPRQTLRVRSLQRAFHVRAPAVRRGTGVHVVRRWDRNGWATGPGTHRGNTDQFGFEREHQFRAFALRDHAESANGRWRFERSRAHGPAQRPRRGPGDQHVNPRQVRLCSPKLFQGIRVAPGPGEARAAAPLRRATRVSLRVERVR
jgi:hypothetical protein